MARWGSLNTTEKAGCLLLEGWPSIKHSSQLFILQPLSEQYAEMGLLAGAGAWQACVGDGDGGVCSASEFGNLEL